MSMKIMELLQKSKNRITISPSCPTLGHQMKKRSQHTKEMIACSCLLQHYPQYLKYTISLTCVAEANMVEIFGGIFGTKEK